MFSELPKLLDRNFAIGYFLPAVTFLAVSGYLLTKFKLIQLLLLSQTDILVGTTIAGLISWLGGIFLLAANWRIIRLMEGYGKLNPLGIFKGIEKRRYRKLHNAISELKKK